jgi:predicted ATP-dependent endonuclease of OLD family
MKLTKFHVQMYKSVLDSRPVQVEPLTVVVGKNEAGKTTLLKALHKLNPATPEPYSIEREWPRGKRRGRSGKQVVCTATFALDADDVEALLALTDQVGSVETVDVSRDYDGNLEVRFPNDLFPAALHPNQVDKHCAALPPVPTNATAPYQTAAAKCREEANRLAREGRFTELEALAARHSSVLQGALAPGDQPTHAAEQQHLSQHVQALQGLVPKLKALPSIQRQAHDCVVRRLPKFIYMSDFRTFRGNAILNQVQERRNQKQLQSDDETFLMILKLSGLDLDDLVTKGNAVDRESRQYDLDDGARTLTEQFKERLKQREYAVQFRADGQQFYTMVTDQTDEGLIRLEERSKGFQWFFSFDLLFMHESGGTFQNCVLLLDEPGLHLHPDAQSDLLVRLAEYAKGNTLIYSTHLPFMLDLHQPERIRVITETDEGPIVTEDLTQSQPAAKLTLQAALGMSARQSYLVAPRNVIVEGADDFMLVTELSNLLWRSGEEGLPEDVHITPAGGASEAAYIATFMIGQKLDVVVLLDTDQAGATARDKLVKSWLTRYQARPAQVLHLAEAVDSTSDDFAIEDLFAADFYLDRVKDVYRKQIAAAGIQPDGLKLNGSDQLGKRVERALAAHQITFNKGSVAKRIRRDLSQMQNVSALPAPTQGYARKLVGALRAALGEMPPRPGT